MLKEMNKKLTIITAVACMAILAVCIMIHTARASWPSFVTGQDTLAAKGTPEQLTSVSIPEDMNLVLKAQTTNAGIIYLGSSSATALNTNDDHFKLYPGESVELNITNTNLIWYDAETGEGVEWISEAN